MFTPTRDQVRDFFIGTWQKHQQKNVLAPIESIALKWILEHPEYHDFLNRPEAKAQDFTVSEGKTNPFLHLSMHLALEEQISIDSPPGIKKVFEQLRDKRNPHEAMHLMMECLGQVIWEAQRLGTPLDNHLYLDLLQKQLR